jgi:hypothetical protein
MNAQRKTAPPSLPWSQTPAVESLDQLPLFTGVRGIDFLRTSPLMGFLRSSRQTADGGTMHPWEADRLGWILGRELEDAAA